MVLIVATLLLFVAGPFVMWPLIKTPPDESVASPPAGEGGRTSGAPAKSKTSWGKTPDGQVTSPLAGEDGRRPDRQVTSPLAGEGGRTSGAPAKSKTSWGKTPGGGVR